MMPEPRECGMMSGFMIPPPHTTPSDCEEEGEDSDADTDDEDHDAGTVGFACVIILFHLHLACRTTNE